MNGKSPGAGEKTAPSGGKRRRALSPITRRILAVNVFALAVLVTGLLYVGEYRRGLIESELAAMLSQAQLFAGALGEAAVGADGPGDQRLLEQDSRQIVRRLSSATRTRARLFRANGSLVTDSRLLRGPGGAVEIEDLPPPSDEAEYLRRFLRVFDRLVRLFRPAGDGRQPVTGIFSANQPEMARALRGETDASVSAGAAGRQVLSVAVPVQRYKKVLGALVLSKGSEAIDDSVFEVRLNILKIFAVSLLITVLLSIYLAGTIARPLRRLAEAAERIKSGVGRRDIIPDYGTRNDEIGELSGALRDMTESLWRRMDAIESFAADVAHEIKNPLTSLRSAVETAARIDDAEQQKKLMGIIQEDVLRLDRLITDISSASRLDAELSRAEMEDVDLCGILKALIRFRADGAENGAVRVTLNGAETVDGGDDDGGDDDFTVPGIEDRLVQVFRNIISNAESFSPADGVIDIEISRDGGFVRVVIADQGPGIPDGMEETIFDRFYRERPAAEKFGTHSGLGLSISRQIIETHGGTIHAEKRAPGALGASIVVRLPRGAENTPKDR